MAQWKKTLARMLRDTKCVGYTYDEVSNVLERLGYVLSPCSGGSSHRAWRLAHDDGTLRSYVGLVEKGHGTLKPYLVRDLVTELRAKGVVPADTAEQDQPSEGVPEQPRAGTNDLDATLATEARDHDEEVGS